MAVQSSDGKVVVVGYGARDLTTPCDSPPLNDFVVARLTTSGTLDTTFGDSASVGRTGWTTTGINGHTDRANAVAVQSDGKIVVAGQAGAPNFDSTFGVARFNSDGTLDTAFGSTCSAGETPGTTTTDFAGQLDQGAAVAIQSDGKIVVAGSTLTSSSNFDFALARYDTNGCPDTTFGAAHDGKVVQGFPAGGNDKAHALVIQPSGKIVVAGSAFDGTINEFGLARFNTDGSLDTSSFGTNGETLTDFGGGGQSTSANGLVQQSDGELVAAGGTFVGAATWIDFALARYSANGVLDGSFGTGGKVTTNFSPRTGFGSQSTDIANALAIQSDGKIVAGGNACCDAHATNDFALARYNPDGSPDTSFGANGQLIKDIAGGEDEISAVSIQPDDKILTAGWDTILSNSENEFVVDRYLGGSGPVPTTPVTPLPGGGGAPATDVVAPAFLAATLTNKTFVVDRHGPAETAIPAAAKKGTTFVYTLSEPSLVVFTVDRKQNGRRIGRRCRKPSPKNRHRKPCVRYVKVGAFSQASIAGINREKFSGRIGRRSLKPGSYRATLQASDPSGNKSKLKRLGFKVVRK